MWLGLMRGWGQAGEFRRSATVVFLVIFWSHLTSKKIPDVSLGKAGVVMKAMGRLVH